MSKYFITLTPTQFMQVTALLAQKAKGYEHEVNKLIESCAKTTVNPLSETDIANAVLFEGNILLEVTT